MSTLDDVINRIRWRAIDRELWLYIEGNGDDLDLHTPAELGIPEYDDATDEETGPRDLL